MHRRRFLGLLAATMLVPARILRVSEEVTPRFMGVPIVWVPKLDTPFQQVEPIYFVNPPGPVIRVPATPVSTPHTRR